MQKRKAIKKKEISNNGKTRERKNDSAAVSLLCHFGALRQSNTQMKYKNFTWTLSVSLDMLSYKKIACHIIFNKLILFIWM